MIPDNVFWGNSPLSGFYESIRYASIAGTPVNDLLVTLFSGKKVLKSKSSKSGSLIHFLSLLFHCFPALSYTCKNEKLAISQAQPYYTVANVSSMPWYIRSGSTFPLSLCHTRWSIWSDSRLGVWLTCIRAVSQACELLLSPPSAQIPVNATQLSQRMGHPVDRGRDRGTKASQPLPERKKAVIEWMNVGHSADQEEMEEEEEPDRRRFCQTTQTDLKSIVDILHMHFEPPRSQLGCVGEDMQGVGGKGLG